MRATIARVDCALLLTDKWQGCRGRSEARAEMRQARWIYARVVVLLIDHVHLRPGGELHVVVRALQACIRYSISRVHTGLEASGEWQVAASCPARQGRSALDARMQAARNTSLTFLPQQGASGFFADHFGDGMEADGVF